MKWVPKKHQSAQPFIHVHAQNTTSTLSAKPIAAEEKLIMPHSVHMNSGTSSTAANTLQPSEMQGQQMQELTADTTRTDFELQVLEYEEDERIDLHLRNDVKKLADSIRTRDYKFNFSSTSRVVCSKCDMHFWKASYIHTKKHVRTCQRAQTIKPVIHELHSMDSQCRKNVFAVFPMDIPLPAELECDRSNQPSDVLGVNEC
jgi:hypothetical protein